MVRQSDEQKEVIRDVMHDYKAGQLKSSSGDKVKSHKQAIAIALHEAGASDQESPAKNRENLRRTRAGKRGPPGETGPTRKELYEEAREKGIHGRSRMSKVELARVLSR